MPSDLTQAVRPLAALPHRSCEDAATCSPPPPYVTAELNSSSTGGGLQTSLETFAPATHPSNSSREGQVGSGAGARTGVETRGQTMSVPQVVNMYRLCPKLRDAFAPVGATDSAYSFREVVVLLKKYLFSKDYLFDPKNRLYVNCESDPLGQALGVKRFHFNDVRSLISQNIIKVQPASGQSSLCGPTPVPDKLSSSSSSDASSLCIDRSNGSTCGLLVPPGAAACTPVTGIVSSQGGQTGLASEPTTSSVPGPNRVCGKDRVLAGPSSPPLDIICPDIPLSCSDTETIYSVQGYETEYCRNTEFESSEEEEVMEVNSDTFEEYELPSDDPGDEKEQYSDSDSTVDDVEIAVLAYTLVQDDVEDGFCADDDSDTDEGLSDEDNDPECVSDRWDCLTCGLKNKPFVRYCGKCWQLRKNWLPDRPKKRKRKPRPKKRNLRKGMASGSSEQQPSSQDTCSWEDCKARSCTPESSIDESIHSEKLVKTSSISSTSSTGSSSTQDSGFASSQDLLSQDLLESQELSENFVREISAVETKGPQPSTSKGATQKVEKDLKDTVQPKTSSSLRRKRKSSSSEDFIAAKHSKIMEEKEEVPSEKMESLPSEGRTWKNSSEGLNIFRLVQVSPDVQESRTKKIAELSSSSVPGTSSGFSSTCSICCLRPKNAAIIHGRLSHQATCYQCARRLLDAGARCPVCRRKIHMVCKNIIV